MFQGTRRLSRIFGKFLKRNFSFILHGKYCLRVFGKSDSFRFHWWFLPVIFSFVDRNTCTRVHCRHENVILYYFDERWISNISRYQFTPLYLNQYYLHALVIYMNSTTEDDIFGIIYVTLETTGT